MTDILKIALERRAALHEEIARLDDFVRTAEALLCRLGTGAEAENDFEDRHENDGTREEAPLVVTREIAPGVTRMNLIRRPAAITG